MGGNAQAVGSPAVAAPNAAPAPCKIERADVTWFEAKNRDMPITCNLLSPDNKTEILNVEVKQFPTPLKPVVGQPTIQSTTSFTLNLTPGSYAILITIGALSTAHPASIIESCPGNNELAWIPAPNTSGNFRLRVV